MPMLIVTCARCKSKIPTGMEMSYEAYRNATLMTHIVECPKCKHQQKWTIDDVDRSVFQQQK